MPTIKELEPPLDVQQVSGQLYRNQGEAFPVRVIAVSGRKSNPTNIKLAPKQIPRLTSWEEVFGKIEEVNNASQTERTRMESEGRRGSTDLTSDNGSSSKGPRSDLSGGLSGKTNGNAGANVSGKSGGRTGSSGGGGGTLGGAPGGTSNGTPESESDRPKIPGSSSSIQGGEQNAPTGGISNGRGGSTGEGENGPPPTPPADEGGTTGDRGPERRNLSRKDHAVTSVSEFQDQYTPKSNSPSLDTVIPKYMTEGVLDALDDVTDRHGDDVDAYVAGELGYVSVGEMQNGLAGEQVDGIALAIDQLEQNKGIIIGESSMVIVLLFSLPSPLAQSWRVRRRGWLGRDSARGRSDGRDRNRICACFRLILHRVRRILRHPIQNHLFSPMFLQGVRVLRGAFFLGGFFWFCCGGFWVVPCGTGVGV